MNRYHASQPRPPHPRGISASDRETPRDAGFEIVHRCPRQSGGTIEIAIAPALCGRPPGLVVRYRRPDGTLNLHYSIFSSAAELDAIESAIQAVRRMRTEQHHEQETDR